MSDTNTPPPDPLAGQKPVPTPDPAATTAPAAPQDTNPYAPIAAGEKEQADTGTAAPGTGAYYGTPKRRKPEQADEGSKPESTGEENPYEPKPGQPQDNGMAIMERLRLNRQDAYYRGTLAGSLALKAMHDAAVTPDAPDTPAARKDVNKKMREQYAGVVADLQAYDQMRPYGTTLEATVAFGGQLEGSMVSPESWIGWGARGATWLGRAAFAGATQAAVQTAIDPARQALQIGAGQQDQYNPLQTLMAPVQGFAMGFGPHLLGEGVGYLVGQHALRKELHTLGGMDPDFADPRHAQWALDPANGIEAPQQAPRETPPGTQNTDLEAPQHIKDLDAADERARAADLEAPQFIKDLDTYGAGPTHGFADAVAARKEELTGSHRWGPGDQQLLDETARRQVFDQEAAPDLKAAAEHYGVPPDVDVDGVWEHYDRQPGEHPKAALTRAIHGWAEGEERKALSDGMQDSEFRREMEEADRAEAAEARRPHAAGTSDLRQAGESGQFIKTYNSPTELPAGPRLGMEPTPLGDIPFETSEHHPNAGESVQERGGPQPGEGENTAGGGSGAGPVGERGGERPAGTEAAAGQAGTAGGRAAGVTPRRVPVLDELYPGAPQAAHDLWLEHARQEDRITELVDRDAPKEEIDAAQRVSDGLYDRVEKSLEPYEATPEEHAHAVMAPFGEAADSAEELASIAQRRKGGSRLPAEQGRPKQGVPALPPEERLGPQQQKAIQSLQQMGRQLAEAVGVPVRQGKIQMRNALGIYKWNRGVVRTREVPDFEVVAHEVGHYIENRLGSELTNLTNLHAIELAPMVSNSAAYDPKDYVREGFAEFNRRYIGNPAAAQKAAPKFYNAYLDYLNKNAPEIRKALDEAQNAYRDYLDAPSIDAVQAVRRSVSDHKEGAAATLAEIREKGLAPVVKAFMQESAPRALRKAYSIGLDQYSPVHQVVRELGEAIQRRTGKNVKLEDAYNPEALLRLSGRSQQAATRDLMDGVRPYHSDMPEGPALSDAIAHAIGADSVWHKWDEGALGDFDSYMIAKRAAWLWDEHRAGRIDNPPVSFSKADALQAMKDYQAAYPNFETGSQMVNSYTRQLLRKGYEGNLIAPDLYHKLIQEPFYVPFNRDMSDKGLAPEIGEHGSGGGGGGTSEGPGTTELVKRIRGSSRDILSPIESIMRQTHITNHVLQQNDIMLALRNLSRRAGVDGGKYVEEIPAQEARKYTAPLDQAIQNRAREIGMDPADAKNIIDALGGLNEADPVLGSYYKMERIKGNLEPIVFYREGGEIKAMRVMSDKEGHALYETLMKAPKPVQDIFTQIIGTAASVQRAGIVSNPTFIISNYIRDQFAASILRSDYVPIWSGLKGIKDEVTQAQNAVLYGYAGGVAGGASTGPVEHVAAQEIDALRKKGYAVQRFTSVKGLMEAATITEAGTRNSIFGKVYEAGKARGLSGYEAMVEAAFQAQDMLDFSRHGSRTQAVARMIPFFNAHFQGLDKARRTFAPDGFLKPVFEKDVAARTNAINALFKFAAVGGGLGAVYAAVMNDNEAYRDASPYFKGTHLVIPFGNRILVAPKPFELGVGFTAGEYAFAALHDKDPRAAGEFAQATWQAIQPPDPIENMPVLSAASELMLGKSFFTGRDIVPERLQGLPGPQQYDDRTSEMAKAIGRVTGWSPIKVDYAIGSQFGTWGRDVMALSQGVSEDSPAASLDDAFFLRRFVKDPTRSSETTKAFWDFMSPKTGKYNMDVQTYRSMVTDALTRGQPLDGAEQMLARLPDAEKAFVTLKEGAKENGKPAFTADEKRLHPLQRAYDAVILLNGLRRELSSNTMMTYGERTKLQLNPEQRRDLLQNVRILSQMEMRNAFAIMGTDGYAGRPVLNPGDVLDSIRHISPAVANEIGTRYATAKIYSTTAVQQAWPQLKNELVHYGSGAEIRDLVGEARSDGYAFGGDRSKRPGVSRAPIAGDMVH